MIAIRIVRMTFLPEKISEFLKIFEYSKEDIRNMPGCLYLELWRDLSNPNILITHSHWESEEMLNAYRRTEFFTLVWKRTKALFAEAPLVFSAEKVS